MDRKNILRNGMPFPLNGLVSYWRLDETSGTVVYDSVGGNNGTANNARVITGGADGKIGRCADFTQGNDVITIPTISNTLTSTNSSISLWVKPSSLHNSYIFSGRAGSTENRFTVIWMANNTTYNGFACKVGDSSQTPDWCVSTTPDPINEWHHIVALNNGTTMQLWVNGVFRSSRTVTATNYTINNALISTFSDFNGFVDEVGIWNRALTPEEIKTLYNGSKGKYLPIRPFNGLTAYYRLDETSGTVVHDSVGGNNGSTANTTWTTGKINNGLLFNSSTNLTTIPNSASLTIAGNLTVSAWVYPTSNPVTTNQGFIVYKGVYPHYNYRLLHRMDSATPANRNKFEFGMGIGGTLYELITTNTYALDNWYFLTGVYDGTEMKLYVNGIRDSRSVTGTVSTSTQSLYFGRYQPTATNEYAYKGLIDEVGIWNRALSIEEIQALYNEGRGKYLPMQPYLGLQHYYPLQSDGSDTVSGKNGVPTGTITYSAGKNGNAATFDASAFHTLAAAGDTTFNYQAFTINCWVKFTGTTGSKVIYSNDFTSHTSPFYGVHIRTEASGGVTRFYGAVNRGVLIQYSDDTVLSEDTWYLYTLTADATGTRWYRNGAIVHTNTTIGALTYYGMPVKIGRGNFATTAGLTVDELGIWNRALSANEITELYNQGNGRFY